MITTIVGNYPKIGPGTSAPSLRGAITQFQRGRITQEQLHEVEDQVTAEVIREQVEAGIDLVTDGHVRRDDPQTYFADGIKGFAIGGLIRYFDSNTYYRHPIAEEKLAWEEPITVRDYEFASKNSPKPVKAVITGPYTLARLSQQGCYGEFDAMVMDLAEALNREALALQEAGAPVIQFDEPAILKYKDDFPIFQESCRVLTRGLSVKTALCTYFRDVSGLVPQLYQLPFEVFGLDFAWGPGNYELLDGFPQEKELAMGLLDGRNTRLEPVDEIVAAVRRVSARVPLDRLHLSTSCGLEFLPRQNARQKLARLVEGAKVAEAAA